ncbi:hypothetical protein HDE_06677 [Halotydeus destructor]|nr:hypothetical protein HDE_06677 [Halotydeus destructor]
MYCTLPRSGHSSTANGQWLVQSGVNSNVLLIGSRSSVSSTDSVVNYVDKLFDPILNQESHYGDCSTIRSTGRPMSATSQLAEPESQQLSQQLSQQSSQLWPASASNLAANQHRQLNSSNARLYFAVDSFDDLKALRRSSAQLEASCMSLNSSNCDSASLIATTPPISDHQVPNFYGGVTEPETLNHHRGSQSSTASSTDSAYDSSNESLKVQLRKEPGPKTFAEYKKLVAQNNAQNGSRFEVLHAAVQVGP